MKYVRVDSRQSLEVRDGFPEEVASDGPPQRSVQESEGKRKGIQAERSGLRKHLGVRKPVIIQHLRVGASVCQALSWGLERDPSPTFLGRWGGGVSGWGPDNRETREVGCNEHLGGPPQAAGRAGSARRGSLTRQAANSNRSDGNSAFHTNSANSAKSHGAATVIASLTKVYSCLEKLAYTFTPVLTPTHSHSHSRTHPSTHTHLHTFILIHAHSSTHMFSDLHSSTCSTCSH